MENWLNFIRGLVRPFLTISGWATLLYLAIATDGELRVLFAGAMATVIGYWFAERKK